MKKIFSVAAFLYILNLTGCYTVIWTPGMENTIPKDTYAYDDSSYYYGNSDYIVNDNRDTTYTSNENPDYSNRPTSDYFYDPNYYGTYTQYYYHPWWLSYAAPKKNNDGPKKEKYRTGSGTDDLRNSGGGRVDYGRNTGSSTDPTQIINNAPPAVTTSGTTTRTDRNGDSDNKSGKNNNNPQRSTNTGTSNNDNKTDGGRK